MDFPQHSRHVLEQLNQQRQLGLLCDCTFVVDGVDFKAHKAVLAACSEYFKMLFVDQKDVVHLDISNAAGTPPGSGRACGGPEWWPAPCYARPSWGSTYRPWGAILSLPHEPLALIVYQVPAAFWRPVCTRSGVIRGELAGRAHGSSRPQ